MLSTPISKGWKRVKPRIYSNGRGKYYTQVSSYLNAKIQRRYFETLEDAEACAMETQGDNIVDGWYKLDDFIATNNEKYLVQVQVAKVRVYVESEAEAYRVREQAFAASQRKATKYVVDERGEPYDGEDRIALLPDAKIRQVETQSKRGKTFVTWYEGSKYISVDVSDKPNAEIEEITVQAKRTCNKLTDVIYVAPSSITNFHEKHYRFKQQIIHYEEQPVPIDPYFLGAWLGDGDSARVCITNIDEPIIEFVQNYAIECGLHTSRYLQNENLETGAMTFSYNIVNYPGQGNPLLKDFKKLDLIQNKHIPQIYLHNSMEVRLKVLAGLIDTDGHQGGNQYEIFQKNEQLALDIKNLAQSLGFYTINKPCKKYCMYKGEKREAIYQRITVHLDVLSLDIPLLLQRKKFDKNRVTQWYLPSLKDAKQFGVL